MATNRTPELELARQALASLELFMEHYASSTPYQEHKQKVIEMVAHRGANVQMGDRNDNFLTRFAAALQML